MFHKDKIDSAFHFVCDNHEFFFELIAGHEQLKAWAESKPNHNKKHNYKTTVEHCFHWIENPVFKKALINAAKGNWNPLYQLFKNNTHIVEEFDNLSFLNEVINQWYDDQHDDIKKARHIRLNKKLTDSAVQDQAIRCNELSYHLTAKELVSSTNIAIQALINQDWYTNTIRDPEEGKKALRLDGPRGILFNGINFCDINVEQEITSKLETKEQIEVPSPLLKRVRTTSSFLNLSPEDQNFEAFLTKVLGNDTKLALRYYYNQSLLNHPTEIINKTIAKSGYLLTAKNSTGMDKVYSISTMRDGTLCIDTTIRNMTFYWEQDPISVKAIKIPGLITFRQEVKPGKGVKFVSCSVSNYWLYQCVMNATMDPSNKKQIALARAEEKFNAAMQALAEHVIELRKENSKEASQKAYRIEQMANALNKEMKTFLLTEHKLPDITESFLEKTKLLIQKTDKEVRGLRAWPGLIANVLVATTGIGALVMGIKFLAGYDPRIFRSASAKKTTEVEEAVVHLTRVCSPAA